MAGLFRGAWARSTGRDRGRVLRLVQRCPSGDAWLCEVVSIETGEVLYKTDERIDSMVAVDSTTEPLFILALETLAGPYPYD